MPSFIISASSTTPQLLGNNEYGVIEATGSLVASGSRAIGIVASSDPVSVSSFSRSLESTTLSVFGAVTSLEGFGVGGTAEAAFDMVVGATGQVVALGNAAVEVYAVTSASVRNAGYISGVGAGVILGAADEGVNLWLTNTGTIESLGSAVRLYAESGSVRIVNTGQIITATPPSGNGVTVFGQTIDLQQSGDIVGNVQLLATNSTTLTNSGLIDGDVYLGSTGNASNDTFRNIGGIVTGTVYGGPGNDRYVVDGTDVKLSDSAGNDTVIASASFRLALGIETLVLAGFGNTVGTGNASDNTITGNDGDNLLRGWVGADTLDGGDGDDELRGGLGNDSLKLSEGADRLFGGLGSDTLDGGSSGELTVNLATGIVVMPEGRQTISGIENVNGSGLSDLITGDELGNLLNGGFGWDELNGGGGSDTLNGGSGLDTLNGGEGNDRLIGGEGTDVLTGGASRDLFVFTSSDFGNLDRITDFDGSGDLIDLSAIDANRTAAGDGAFQFGGANFLAEGIASIRIVVQAGDTFVEVRDTFGSTVDMKIRLTGQPTLTAADFLL